MNWIKIDHDNYECIPLCTEVLAVHFDAGFPKYYVGHFEENRNFKKLVLKFGSLNASISMFSYYAIIEEPKQRKYDSIIEVCEVCKITYRDLYQDDDDSLVLVFSHRDGQRINFKEKSLSECEQKILDWANDEL